MPRGTSDDRHSSDRKRRRAVSTHGLAAVAQERSLRFGAPSTAVDPLLSLLFDIRRLEQRVIAALTELGVDRSNIPMGSDATSRERVLPSPVKSTDFQAPADAISAYAAVMHPSIPAAADGESLSQRVATVEAVLHWLDGPTPKAADTEREKSRHILAGLIAAHGDAEAPPVIVTAGEAPPPAEADSAAKLGSRRVSPPPQKPSLCFTPRVDVAGEELVSLGVFDTEVVEGWGRYAEGLSAAIAEMVPLIRSVCATTLSSTRCSHAKWVEVNSDEAAKPFSVPSCTGVKTNFDQIIKANDALASCQVAMRDRLIGFEDALEDFVEEAAAVCRVEEQYWHNVCVFEAEYNALRAIKRAVTRVLRAFHREEGIPIRHTYKRPHVTQC